MTLKVVISAAFQLKQRCSSWYWVWMFVPLVFLAPHSWGWCCIRLWWIDPPKDVWTLELQRSCASYRWVTCRWCLKNSNLWGVCFLLLYFLLLYFYTLQVTCFLDEHAVLCGAGFWTEPHQVDGINSEDVLVAHDEVRHNTVSSPAVIVDRVPLLQSVGENRSVMFLKLCTHFLS